MAAWPLRMQRRHLKELRSDELSRGHETRPTPAVDSGHSCRRSTTSASASPIELRDPPHASRELAHSPDARHASMTWCRAHYPLSPKPALFDSPLTLQRSLASSGGTAGFKSRQSALEKISKRIECVVGEILIKM